MPNPTLLLPIALAIIMFGLGLSLTTSDFLRVARFPKAVVIALICQIFLLPAVTFGLVILFQLPPLLAVGMMLIVAAPGGTIANVLSHLFGGNVALNITLTAINSITAILTIPIVVNVSLAYFNPAGGQIGLQFQKALEIAAMVLLPVIGGMIVRKFWPSFARLMDKPVRIASLVILALVILATVLSSLATLAANIGSLLVITTLVCVISLAVGFFVPRAFRVSRPESISSALEIGLHNGAVALVIARSVLQNPVIALPPAIYGVVSILLGFITATVFRGMTSRGDRSEAESVASGASAV